MATVTKAVLKTYFEQGDIPTQGQYVDLIDSQFGLGETGTQIIQGTISASSADIEDMTFKKLHLPGNGIDSMKVGTTFRVGRSLEVSGSFNVTHGNITITTSGEFQGENATITNISGSFISASGHIYSAGNITASGHVSGSGESTASFGRIQVAREVEHAGDPLTMIKFANDSIEIKANDFRGAKFATTGGTSFGNSTYPASITGSTISLSGRLTGSSATFSGTTVFTGTITGSSGIVLTQGGEDSTVGWETGEGFTTVKRTFQTTITSLPKMNEGKIFSEEFMTITNQHITTKSIILVNQAAYANDSGRYISFHVSNVIAQRCTITPILTNGTEELLVVNGSATYNFIIL